MKIKNFTILILSVLILNLIYVNVGYSQTVRIKDITTVYGVNTNPLIGYGLVVGLAGTGDKSYGGLSVNSVAKQTLVNMLKNMGIIIDEKNYFYLKNVAAVMVTADLPAFASAGEKIDITVSSLADATSLEGGILLLTYLQGADGQIYLSAQGPLSVGGMNTGIKKNQEKKNYTLTGRIANGGLVLKPFYANLVKDNKIILILSQEDFTVAKNITEIINKTYGEETAKTLDSSRVEITLPTDYEENPWDFISQIENLNINIDNKAVVVINERTGTVIIGGNVKVLPVAISHGNLKISISATEEVSQPSALSLGTTKITQSYKTKAKEEDKKISLLKNGSTIENIVDALNSLGVTPRDLISVLQALKEAGALQAELKVM